MRSGWDQVGRRDGVRGVRAYRDFGARRRYERLAESPQARSGRLQPRPSPGRRRGRRARVGRTARLIAAAGPLGDVDQPPIVWNAARKPVEALGRSGLPRMTVIPAGEYTMGSPEAEPGRDVDEGPRHRVRIGYSFAMGVTHVTVGEFKRFIAETHYDAGSKCVTQEGGEQPHPDRDFLNPSYAQTIDDPVVCMSLDSIQAYLSWLSGKTGHVYRLPTEAEYEYAERAGSTSPLVVGRRSRRPVRQRRRLRPGHQGALSRAEGGELPRRLRLHRAGRPVQAQPVRPVRHGGRGLDRGGRLLARQLRRRAERRIGHAGRRLRPKGHARRLLEQRPPEPALGPPQQERRHRPPRRRNRLSGWRGRCSQPAERRLPGRKIRSWRGRP